MTTIISLGGSLIVPENVDFDFIKKFVGLIRSCKEKFVIITGGGKTARIYQQVNVSAEDKDWLGIYATQLNANLLRICFGEAAYDKIVTNPTKKISTDKIIIASGWKPGCSTDYDAVLMAKAYGADRIINMTNVNYLYDKDPKEEGAKIIEDTNWPALQKIVGDKWTPGLNTPFDPIATRLAAKLNLKLFIIGKDINNLKNLLAGREFKGTIIE